MHPPKNIPALLLCLVISIHSIGQVDTIRWQNKAPLPSTPRIDYGSFVIDSDYYIIGGVDSILDWLSEVWKYNLVANT